MPVSDRAEGRARSLGRALVDASILLACLAAAAGLAVLLGQDANWDLQNYHYYNPWAWWHDHRGYGQDVVAAQLQTYHNPLPDLPFYLMVRGEWDPRIIAVMLALPGGIAAFFLWKLCADVFDGLPTFDRRVAVASSFAIGVTSSIGFGVLGTTMNEWPGTACLVAALYVVVRRTGGAVVDRLPASTLAVSGVLCGFATGTKFTFGVFAIALCAAILLRGPLTVSAARRAVGEAFVFGIAVLVGTAAAAGPWMWSLWQHFGNPVFPYGNVWFKSPWWGQYPVLARSFGPHTLLEWLVFPFTLGAPRPFYVAEVTLVDGRIPAVFALALALLATAIVRRARSRHELTDPAVSANPKLALLSVFFAVSFLLWTAQFSILRYTVPLMVISGALIVAMLNALVRPAARGPVAAMAAAALVGTTSVADWWRVEFGEQWFDVRMPPVESNALVLLATDAPMSYVLPTFPPDARFLGINNSISDARRKTLMEETITRRIGQHTGPIYELSYPWGTGADALLERNLRRRTDRCNPVVTNMRTSPIELCLVERVVDGPAQPAARTQ